MPRQLEISHRTVGKTFVGSACFFFFFLYMTVSKLMYTHKCTLTKKKKKVCRLGPVPNLKRFEKNYNVS